MMAFSLGSLAQVYANPRTLPMLRMLLAPGGAVVEAAKDKLRSCHRDLGAIWQGLIPLPLPLPLPQTLPQPLALAPALPPPLLIPLPLPLPLLVPLPLPLPLRLPLSRDGHVHPIPRFDRWPERRNSCRHPAIPNSSAPVETAKPQPLVLVRASHRYRFMRS